MDGTVMELDKSGNGRGCLSGWANPDDLAGEAGGFCGPVTGNVDGDHVVLDLALTGYGGLHYGIDGTLSANGQRIGGILRVATTSGSYEQPVATIRYDRSVESEPYPRGKAWPDAAQNLAHNPLLTQTAQGPFRVGERYRLGSSAWRTLGGDLGNYLGTEITIDAPTPDDVTFHAGPVPATAADTPIGLTAHHVKRALVDVVVEMPSGEVFTLFPAPEEP